MGQRMDWDGKLYRDIHEQQYIADICEYVSDFHFALGGGVFSADPVGDYAF